MRASEHPNNAPGVPMIFPPWLENLQVKYINRLIRPFSKRMPGLGVIKHRGRTSGKPYETIVTRTAKATCSRSGWHTARPTGSRTSRRR